MLEIYYAKIIIFFSDSDHQAFLKVVFQNLFSIVFIPSRSKTNGIDTLSCINDYFSKVSFLYKRYFQVVKNSYRATLL